MLAIFAAPTTYPVTVDECKLNSRIQIVAEDALIQTWVEAATQDAEAIMTRAVMPQQWKLTLDGFAMSDRGACDQVLYLRRPTVTAVDHVKYVDATTGVLTTLPGTEWQADLSSDLQARLAPAYGKAWPSTRVQMAAVEVLFTCGWANANAVPKLIKAWIMLRVGGYYENRAQWTTGKPIEQNAFLDFMLDRWRVPTL